MDLFLGKVTQQAMNYAIRSGVTLTATYAIRQSSKLLQTAPKSGSRDELFSLQQRLQHKIRIVSPAIDMIELIAARGNTSLESAVSLTKELRLEIQELGQRLGRAAAASEEYATGSSRNKANLKVQNELELAIIVDDIKKLLVRIEDAVPLINLALTTSGARLSTQLPSTVSPSRLLQASTFLTAGDTQYALNPHKTAQVGPTFTLTVYMLFAGHTRPQNDEELRNTTWKEVIHKARVKLRRVPLDVVVGTGSGSEAIPSIEISSSEPNSRPEEDGRIPAEGRADEYAYQMMIIEDLDDDRIHEFDDDDTQPGPFDDVRLAGIREMIPIHEISKIFYADTSKVLNIGTDTESNHPVILLKRDVNAVPPRRMHERDEIDNDAQDDDNNNQRYTDAEQRHVNEDHGDRKRDPWRLPPSLDPEWIAFEVYEETPESDDESEPDSDIRSTKTSSNNVHTSATSKSPTQGLETSMSQLSLNKSSIGKSPQPWIPQIKTSLSMLELLLRLTSLQQFQQQSHLSITDELLNFFLEESASTGAGGDEPHRQALRADARRRVGWDPYDESPLKRRGEEYQYNHQQQGYYSPGPGSVAGSARASPAPDRRTTPVNGSTGGQGYLARAGREVWSPSTPEGAQTRSMTGTPGDGAYNASPSPKPQDRSEWLRKQDGQRKESPLRRTEVRDEGLGTSPASGMSA